ncbi:MAG: hypothetical protein A2Y38_18165 [Spirochaetes bacterium GWB1_59_5]|nr:MAG: hypothetical protein A2Y38_18165 [Spirochaetes bacterium GWB1_59_5]
MTKYHNRQVEWQGISFRSMLEMRYAQALELRRHAEEPGDRVDWWVYELPFYLPVLSGRRPVRHIVDFIVGLSDGRVCLVEVKGMETPTGRVKRLWLEGILGQPISVVESDEVQA